MTSTYEVQVADGLITVRAHGRLDSKLNDEIERALLECRAANPGLAVLYDFRAAGLVGGIVSMNQRSARLDQVGAPRQIKRAILCARRNPEYDFFETVTRNRGYNFRVFTDGAEALDWLAPLP